MKKYLFFLLLFSSSLTQNNELERAKKDVATLCTKKMAGRGYQNEGHVKAAKFIQKRFKNLGIQAINNDYNQLFPIQINSIESATLKINGKKLQHGRDYIIAPNSHSGSNERCILNLNYGLEIDKKEAHSECNTLLIKSGLPENITTNDSLLNIYKFLKSDEAKINLHKKHSKYFIFQKNKLTASLENEADENTVINILDSVIKDEDFQNVDLKVTTKTITTNSQNIIGFIPAINKTDSCIVLTGHYDHLGTQGSIYFPGANDNASGIATLLALGKYFKNKPLQNTNIVLMAFSGEEAGLIGSKYYVEHPLFPLKNIKFLINMDLMGNGTEGIMVVGGNEFQKEWKLLDTINKQLRSVPVIKSRPNAPNSDHYFFLKNGVKGFFIYTMGGPPHYHDIDDTPKNLLFSKFNEVQSLMRTFIEKLD